MTKVTWKQLRRGGRGLCWIAYDAGRVVGGISSVYLPSNNGSAFARNYGTGYTGLLASVTDAAGDDRKLVDVSLKGARTRAQSDKLVRAYIRQHGLRALVEAATLAA